MGKKRTLLAQISLFGKVSIGILFVLELYLNLLSGIVGAIWLAILGHWSFIVGGIILAVIMPWVFWIFALPSMGLMHLAIKNLNNDKPRASLFFGFWSFLYSAVVIFFWTLIIFVYLMRQAENTNIIPYLLWGYAMMMAPLSYMASKEPSDSDGTTLGMIFAQISFIILIANYFFGYNSLWWLYTIMMFALLFSVFSVILVAAKFKKQKLEDYMNEFDEQNSNNNLYS